MYRGKRVAVIVPAFNEEAFVKSVIEAIPVFVDTIVVVDDASTDNTAERVRESGDHRVLLLVNQTNAGAGASVVRGYRRALELGSDILVKVDGDGQMPLEYLESLLEPLVEGYCDYTKGNRFVDRAALKAMPKSRLLGNMALTFLARVASGYWHIADPQNGFTAITADTLRRVDLGRLHRRYFFEDDMLVELNVCRVRVKDVPMPAVYGAETSRMRISSVIITFPGLLFLRFIHRVLRKHVSRSFTLLALFRTFGGLLLAW
jgi:glycosyltransferase involved in cell wall biosynthesis